MLPLTLSSLVTPISNPAAGNRQVQISQVINGLVPGSNYLFTGYQGRLPDSLNDPSPSITVAFGSKVLGTIQACSGTGCGISGPNGAQYTEHIIGPFPYNDEGSSATLQFTITYTSSDTQHGNPPLLFDGFNLKKD
jgi:hypothetical protein